MSINQIQIEDIFFSSGRSAKPSQKSVAYLLFEAKRMTTAKGRYLLLLFSRWRYYGKTMPGDAIVEENSRLFGQPKKMFLYLHHDCTTSGNI